MNAIWIRDSNDFVYQKQHTYILEFLKLGTEEITSKLNEYIFYIFRLYIIT